jgi:hypothetical protein
MFTKFIGMLLVKILTVVYFHFQHLQIFLLYKFTTNE